jgi:hypothetical protein
MIKIMELLTLFGCALVIGCVNSEVPITPQPVKTSGAAHCNECHSYPGSPLCSSDTLVIDNQGFTQCFSCHLGAIKIDSSFDTASKSFVYHDAMLNSIGKNYPLTDSMHPGKSLDLGYSQCTRCHGYPPSTGLHAVHVTTNSESCFECHFSTIVRDSDTATIDQGGVGLFYSQQTRIVPGGVELPRVIDQFHIDNSVEISFRRKYQRPLVPDSMYRYSSFDKSCVNILCHSGVANNGASIALTYWRQ